MTILSPTSRPLSPASTDIWKLAESDPNKAFRQAAAKGKKDVLECIYEKYQDKIDLHGRSSNSYTASDWARKNGHKECLSFLKEIKLANKEIRRAKDKDKKHSLRGTHIDLLSSQHLAEYTSPVRYPHLYVEFLKRLDAKTIPKNPRILLVGPGCLNGASYQLTEMLLLFPDSQMDVLEVDKVSCKQIKDKTYIPKNFKSQINEACSYTTTSKMKCKDLTNLLCKSVDTIKETKAFKNLTLIEEDACDFKWPVGKYDIVVATQSIVHAFEALQGSKDFAKHFEMVILMNNFVNSVRPRTGLLCVDSSVGGDLDYYFKSLPTSEPVKKREPVKKQTIKPFIHQAKKYIDVSTGEASVDEGMYAAQGMTANTHDIIIYSHSGQLGNINLSPGYLSSLHPPPEDELAIQLASKKPPGKTIEEQIKTISRKSIKKLKKIGKTQNVPNIELMQKLQTLGIDPKKTS